MRYTVLNRRGVYKEIIYVDAYHSVYIQISELQGIPEKFNIESPSYARGEACCQHNMYMCTIDHSQHGNGQVDWKVLNIFVFSTTCAFNIYCDTPI